MGILAESIDVELDRKRSLVLDMWAFYQIEKELKREGRDTNAFQFISEFTTNPNTTDALLIFWASLLRDHPGITMEEAGHIAGLRDVFDAVKQVIASIQLKTNENEEEQEEKKTSALNGSKSGPSPALS